MGGSPYLRTWYKLPSLTAIESGPSALLQALLPKTNPGTVEISDESRPLRNPYLTRGRHMARRKASTYSSAQVVTADDREREASDTSAKEGKSSEASRLYLRTWYPA